ncbi:MAG: site-specific DNA-methyltransferase [Chloroflexaceae bacterium]|nr:site-specific DNA-methyltransferase [Chloroflexaceae bacterium]
MANRKTRAPGNRTLTLSEEERTRYQRNLLRISERITLPDIRNKTINQDIFEVLDYLPDSWVDLLFLDPPYNLAKSFHTVTFRNRSIEAYCEWFTSWFVRLLPVLKPGASVYICSDWRSSAAIYWTISRYLIVRNRITWEREKGRGARANWKNCSEDIWFCTVSENYTFNVDQVKLKRRVLAPYTDQHKNPKDWIPAADGNYRLTHPSNLWTDITVPFWSMPENTEHPTQKPEKLLAKLILASSQEGDLVFDPFLGSGTTSVVAKKLGRNYVGIELDPFYCCLAEKRLAIAEHSRSIQGYDQGIFWERNAFHERKNEQTTGVEQSTLFASGPDVESCESY